MQAFSWLVMSWLFLGNAVHSFEAFVCLFVLILYVPVNNFSVMSDGSS